MMTEKFPTIDISNVLDIFSPDLKEFLHHKAQYLNYKLKVECKLFNYIEKNGVRKTAKLLNYSAAYLSDIKNNKRNIGEKILIKFIEKISEKEQQQ